MTDNHQAVVNLEIVGVKTATKAVNFDKQGLKEQAIANYQETIGILKKLCSLYPEAPQRPAYHEYISRYENRVKELEGSSDRTRLVSHHHKPTQTHDRTNLILREKPNVQWNDVIGLEDAKQAILDSIIYPLKRPEFFPLGWPRGILLFGPPGCGKTLLAAATATEIDAAFYCIDSAAIMSKWLGESEKNVARLFDTARLVSKRGQPSIIFMDEIDSLIGTRSEEVGGEVRMRKQLMMEMDGIIDKNKKLHVYVIGTTNKPWNLDEPFLRRFQKRIYVPLPNLETRINILKLYCQFLFRMNANVNILELAKFTEWYSGSDLYDVVQAVHLKVVRQFFQSPTPTTATAMLRPVTMKDFLMVLEERKPSISRTRIDLYERWYHKYKAV